MLIENKAHFKQMLGLVRGNDFAHAGEAAAIDLVFEHLPKNPEQLILDVGSGLGETASYVQEKQWGKVVGIDIDHDTVEYAKRHFPDVEYHQCDVQDVDTVLAEHPDLIYMFNVLYAIKDQQGALEVLREITKPDATLALFIYVDLGGYKDSELKEFQLANPIALKHLNEILLTSGWQIKENVDLNQKYQEWYDHFVQNIKKHKPEIIARSDEESYEFLLKKYTHLWDETKAGTLGGAIVYAQPV